MKKKCIHFNQLFRQPWKVHHDVWSSLPQSHLTRFEGKNEIFGEIDDEHDQEELDHHLIDKETYLFSARLEIDFINEKYRLKLPVKEGYETLSGMIVSYAETIPEKGAIFSIENYELKVLEVDETKISKVQLKVIQED